jgi:hypothetical protein
MKNFFSSTFWASEIDLIFGIVCGTFLLAFIILAILISRGGRSIETKSVLDAIDETRDQLGKVDERIEQDHRFQKNWMLRILNRFGFLEAQDTLKDLKNRPRDESSD